MVLGGERAEFRASISIAAVRREVVVGVPQLERYEIIEELGQGGMSVVYHARDRQLNRDVAVKVLHDFLARQDDPRRRFHREAVAVATLHHPGIVEIFDYSGPDADQSYIVCELIRGRTLRDLIDEDGPVLFPELGALIVAELTRALRHAHERGIIHRDLKPENVMVTRDGHLKLMDFGIAQIMGGATQLTATGTLLGSPAHMAPEMIDGHPADHRSDIFSVGTILYWLSTGELPFSAPNPSALFRKILEGCYEPPQAIQPKLGNGLSRVIDRALATDPDDRYQDISELQSDLDRELRAVGLLPIEEKARAYLARPRPFSDEFRAPLVERLIDAGRTAMSEGNVGRAVDRFNRVLAIEPDHPEVRTWLRRVGRQQTTSRVRRWAATVVGVVALTGLGFGVYGPWPEPAPSAAPTHRSDLAVAGSAEFGAGEDRGPSSGAPFDAEAPVVRPSTPRPARPSPPAAESTPPAAPSRNDPPTWATRGARTETRPSPPRTPRASRKSSTDVAVAEAALPTANRSERSDAAPAAPAATATRAPNDRAATSTSSPSRAVVAQGPFPLLLRIGPGWANVSLNDRLVAEGAYRAELRLSPGRHAIVIENQSGRNPPRTVEVARDGSMAELMPDGSRRSIKGELPIIAPNPAQRPR